MSIAPPKMVGWDVIPAPMRASNGSVRQPVTMSALSRNSRYKPSLLVVIDLRGFEGIEVPSWLRKGAKVWCLRGRGEFSRTLRLMPNGPFVIGAVRGERLRLAIPAMPGHPDEGAARTAVEYEFSDGWFDITFPAWHGDRPTNSAPPPAAPAPAPQQPKPFTLAAGASSHPQWNSPKAQAEHKRAVEGGAA